jgi:hypothetical protein
MTERDDFWGGDITLRREPAEPAEPSGPSGLSGPGKPGAAAPPLDRLAGSGLTVAGRDLAQLLAPVYQALTG